MENQQHQSTNHENKASASRWSNIKSSVISRICIIGFLILLLLIPVAKIKNLVSERQQLNQEVIYEISEKSGGTHSLLGPYISIPYKVENSNNATVIKYLNIFPRAEKIDGNITAELRQRNIYKVPVYQGVLNYSGNFSNINWDDLGIEKKNIVWENIALVFDMTNIEGLSKVPEVKINGKNSSFNKIAETHSLIEEERTSTNLSGSEILQGEIAETNIIRGKGIAASLPSGLATSTLKDLNFVFIINLNGASELKIIPIAKENEIKIVSNWPDPSFNGKYLPTAREINKDGFKAEWDIINLSETNSLSSSYSTDLLKNSKAEINFLLAVDQYQKIMRSVKYSMMLIALIFLAYFLFEIFNKKRVHPIQYLLVGLALSLFYVLLLSLSEYMQFIYAYLISCVLVVVLITIYVKSVFKSGKLAFIQALIMLLLFGFMLTIIELQNYSLLIGSIGLFIILALVMLMTRKIDWYSFSFNNKTEKTK